MALKRQFCFQCGEDLGVYDAYPDENRQSCGNPECERELRDMERGEYEEMRWRAEQDEYERYR